MKVTIKIDCETIAELHGHLSELRRQVKRKATKEFLIPLNDEFVNARGLNDSNCYGTHEVSIKPEN